MDSAFSLNRVEMEGGFVGWIPPCCVLEFRRKRDSFFGRNGFWWKVQTLNIFPLRRINGFCCVIVVFLKCVFRRFFLDFFRKIMFFRNFFEFFRKFSEFFRKIKRIPGFFPKNLISRKIFRKTGIRWNHFSMKGAFYETTKNKRPMHKMG